MDKVKILAKYLPEEAAPLIAKWIEYFKCQFKISRNRNTKFGDYRHPHGREGHRISVNYDLNPYAFLVTTVHEFAHLITWNEYKGQVKPHGLEWKRNFKQMMQPFFEMKLFPGDLHQAISSYLENPGASSCSDVNLFKALRKYDSRQIVFIDSLAERSVFTIKDGREFTKGEKMRKRFKCIESGTGKVYLFSPLAEVYPKV